MSATIRVGIYTPFYPNVTGDGGIGTYTRHLSHGLSALGHEVHVLTPAREPQGDDLRTVPDGPVSVHLARTPHIPLLDRVVPGAGAMYHVKRAAQRLAQRHKLDIFEFANWEGLGAAFARSRRIPLIVRLHTSSAESHAIDGTPLTGRARWDCLREHTQARHADILVTHSLAHRKFMAEELGIEEQRIRVIAHGLPSGYREPEEDCEDSPLRKAEPTVVYVGRMERRKGTLDLLKAIPHVLKEVPEARFVIVGRDRKHCPGDRTHAQYLQEEFPPEVAARVTMPGCVSDAEVDCWMQSATVFVAPSLYESFGLVFIEAMRWGTPVIGTCVGGIPEVIDDGKSGLLVPPSNPEALAKAIATIIKDPVRRDAMGAAARKRFERDFTVERMVRETLALYCEGITQWRVR